MRINQNIAAQNAYRNLSVTQGQQSKSLERLSSGFRINRAADDAAGLAISEKLRGQVGGLKQAVSNAQNGISLLQTAEGALNESHSILQRMRELAVQSANDTNTDADRGQIQKEVNQLAEELTRIGDSTEFNPRTLLNGDLGSTGLTFQIGANEGQTLEVTIGDMRAAALGVATAGTATAATTTGSGAVGTPTAGDLVFSVDGGTDITVTLTGGETAADVVTAINTAAGSTVASESGGVLTLTSGTTGAASSIEIKASTTDLAELGFATGTDNGSDAGAGSAVDVSTQTAASDAITTIQTAIDSVSDQRSTLGAAQNRLDHTINNLNVAAENLSASESRIRDTDMAAEMMAFTRSQILSQAGTAMLAQANQVPQSVLSLLR